MFPLIGMPEGAEWLVILAIVILVFGAAKLPDLARGTGQALRIFKAETKGLRDDRKAEGDKPALRAEQIEPSTTAAQAAQAAQDAQAAQQAELDRRQAELDAERARLQQPDA